ncbi:MAG: glutathione S-transferase family protein, partial [Aeromicrobium sp.]
MRTLHHLWLSPLCRKIRLVLAEKKLDFELKVEPVWERRRSFLALNPACEVPVLVEPDQT